MPLATVDAASGVAAASGVQQLWMPPIPLSDAPRIFVVDNFATQAECDEIFRTAEPHLEQSLTQGKDGQSDKNPIGRRSRQYTLSPHRWTPSITSVIDRMDATSMQPLENGQHLTITDYGNEDKYELHVDSSFAVGRTATALLFLEAPTEGGELVFPWARSALSNPRFGPAREPPRPLGVFGAGRPVEETFTFTSVPSLESLGACNDTSDNAALRIRPQVGRLVVFFNHDPMGRTLRPRSLHGSCPVREGRKRIAQRWYQWHALHSENRLGSLLEQVEKANGKTWFVDWRSAEA